MVRVASTLVTQNFDPSTNPNRIQDSDASRIQLLINLLKIRTVGDSIGLLVSRIDGGTGSDIRPEHL